jgi:hypothetical protein
MREIEESVFIVKELKKEYFYCIYRLTSQISEQQFNSQLRPEINSKHQLKLFTFRLSIEEYF